jgi:Protein of unknown function (DUF1761)
MPDISPLAVAVATVTAFIVSSTWYAVAGAQVTTIRAGGDTTPAPQQPPLWKLAVEVLRSLLIATALAAVIAQGDIDALAGVALLSVVTWLAFPVTLLIGSVIWEDVPWKLAALHGGDWLIKLLAVALLIGLLQ